MIVGSGKFRYRVNADWAKLPAGWSFKEVGGVGVDRNDNVYVFNRGEHPMMVFHREGNFLRSWGEGQYPRAHRVHMAPDDTMFLADRENHRVQVFDGNGKFETQGQNLHRPCGLCMTYGHQPIFYVGEVGPAAAVSRNIPNLGPRVSIVDHQGKLIGRFGDTPAGTELGKFLAPHGLAVDSHGDVYVGEVSWTAWPQIYPGKPHPADLRSLQKFEKVG